MGRVSAVSLPAVESPRPFDAVATSRHAFRQATGLISWCWIWIQERKAARSSARRIQVIETVSLGEKRFVAVVQVDKLQFLIGGSPSAVVLLAQLNVPETFGDVLGKTSTLPRKRSTKRRSANATTQTGVDA
jgi:flagellar biogenesis protein FliO